VHVFNKLRPDQYALADMDLEEIVKTLPSIEEDINVIFALVD